MPEVASRELRNGTRGLLDRVAQGETMTITVEGRPAAVLQPVSRRPRWIGRDEFTSRILGAPAGQRPPGALAGPGEEPAARSSAPVTRGLADTSVFIARESGRSVDQASLPDELAVSVITIGELRAAVLAVPDVRTRDRRLATLTDALALDPVPVDESVAAAWASLRMLLREHHRRMPVYDSWIAATALSLGVAVVTHDDDYVKLPGLEIIMV